MAGRLSRRELEGGGALTNQQRGGTDVAVSRVSPPARLPASASLYEMCVAGDLC